MYVVYSPNTRGTNETGGQVAKRMKVDRILEMDVLLSSPANPGNAKSGVQSSADGMASDAWAKAIGT